jgi:polyhydroxyalkanoate synthesis repressor PhaR
MIIKRYPNRKLYDTEAKQYVTLEGIGELIRQGKEVQVIDNASGEDLTTLTLTQIILEQERKQSGFLPHSVLTGLIRASENSLSSLQKGLRTPLGLFHQVDEEIRRRVQTLVKQGELDEKEGTTLLDKLLSLGHPFQKEARAGELNFDQQVENILDERSVPSRADLDQLTRQLEILTAKLDELGKEGTD